MSNKCVLYDFNCLFIRSAKTHFMCDDAVEVVLWNLHCYSFVICSFRRALLLMTSRSRAMSDSATSRTRLSIASSKTLMLSIRMYLLIVGSETPSALAASSFVRYCTLFTPSFLYLRKKMVRTLGLDHCIPTNKNEELPY